MEAIRRRIQEAAERAFRPLAALLARLHISPNHVSLSGAFLNVVAALLVMKGQLVPAGLVYIVASVCDMLDGILARFAQKASPFGAFLDSTLDRISEGVVFAAVAYYFARHHQAVEAGLVVLALVGSLLVSYTRARAEALGAECKVGVMTRAERVILVTFGLLFASLPLVIYIMVVLTGLTVAQRVFHTARQLRPPALHAQQVPRASDRA